MSKPSKLRQGIVPDADEDPWEFMDRCIADGNDPEECRTVWEDNMGSSIEDSGDRKLVHKVHVSKSVEGREFILSDETVDRYGDVISADGWDVRDFRKNPIALFGHRADFPIGTWENVRVAGKELRGHLKMAPEGTSDRIDEIRKLIDAGILRAVSVGFAPIETKPLSKDAPGNLYAKSSLMECSVVAIPANPNSLQVAKSLKISDATQKLVFAGLGNKGPDAVTRQSEAGSPKRTLPKKGQNMSSPVTISQRVKDAEQRQVELKDKLTEHMKNVDDTAPTEEQQTEIDALTAELETSEKSIESLRRVEKHLAVTSKPVSEVTSERSGSEQSMEVSGRMPFAAVKQKVRPSDYIWKALTVQVKAFTNPRMSINDIVKKTYAGQDRLHDNIHAMYDGLITRTATTVGTTTTATWAAELVTVGIGDFFDLLQPTSVYAKLAALGGRFTFGPNGVVSIPYRTSTATVGGVFVAQGGAIPVKKASFNALNLTPKKAAVISTFTRELAEHSTPSIEALLRQAIIDDTATAIDAILMDNTAASTTRPQGMQNYAGSTQTATTSGSGSLADVVADVKTIANALTTASNGNIRTPVWIMTPGQANSIALSQIAAVGVMPFRDEISRGTLNGWPIILSTSVLPTGAVWLVDANDFVSATGDVPRFDVSDQAVIVMDDAATDVVTGGTAFNGAVKSMYQTDSIAIRMILDLNWGWRRAGMAIYMTGVDWD